MDKQIIIKGKIFKVGNSYGLRIKKALIESQLFNDGDEVILTYISNRKTSEKNKDLSDNSPFVTRSQPNNIHHFLGNTFKGLSVMG